MLFAHVRVRMQTTCMYERMQIECRFVIVNILISIQSWATKTCMY